MSDKRKAEPPAVVAEPEPDAVMVPGTGEVVDLRDEVACAQALDALRTFESQIGTAKRLLTQAIVERARELGVPSFDLPGRMRAEIRSGTSTTYSAEVLEQKLRRAGMPEERISEIVVVTVTRSVKAVEAKKAARVNEKYARAVKASASTHEVQPSVTLRRR